MISSPPRVATFGEAMLRFSVPPGERLEDAPAFEVHVAGAEANFAYALARVGVPSLWASALPRNALGRRVAATLEAGGVDVSAVQWLDDARLGTYFLEFGHGPRPAHVVYDREGSAAAAATPDQFDWDHICNASAFHISGISFGLSESAADVSWRALEEARARGLFISFDVNYRQLLSTPEQAAATVEEVARTVDLVICRAEDARDLFVADGDAESTASLLQDRLGVETVVVTDGSNGAVGVNGAGSIALPAYPVEIPIDRIGAGDAFAAGVVWGLLQGSLTEGLERGLAMAALKMTLHGDLFRLHAADVEALRVGHRRQINR